MLKNIVLNLLSNAIKFSPAGKSIWMHIGVDKGRMQIIVRDQGLGIPEEDQPHLFGTFFRAKNVSNIQGTGLGLPIIKRYVDLLHGEISFESRLQEGTTFTIWLPRLESDRH
jgi:signal transduction histidine kinase